MVFAVSKATSKLPHSKARLNRVLSSFTKWRAIFKERIEKKREEHRTERACQKKTKNETKEFGTKMAMLRTSGKPFFCKYAMID
jgi:hypothetical protein